MAGCPNIDGSTIVRENFGQIGVPLDVDGGISSQDDGISLLPKGGSHFIAGVPTFTVGGTTRPALSTDKYTAYSRRDGRIVSFEIIWEGSISFSSGSVIFTGNLGFSLPYDARTVFKGHNNATILDSSVTYYKRSVYLDTALTTQLVNNSFAVVSTSSPISIGDLDRICIYGEYIASTTATYRWG